MTDDPFAARSATIIAQHADELELSEELEQRSIETATRTELEHPINSSPAIIAASAVYARSLRHNEKITQSVICDVFDVSEEALRRVYQEIVEIDMDVEIDLSSKYDKSKRQKRGFLTWLKEVFHA